MNLKFYAPLWGNTLPFESFCERVKTAGYDGVEMELPFEEEEKENILTQLSHYGLELIGQYYQSFEPEIEANAENYERYLNHLAEANPVLINCQTGKDYFSLEENKRLFLIAERIKDGTGVPITHETHRGKCLYSVPVAKQYLEALPDIRLCLDISHWCNVHESLLEDQDAGVQKALQRTDHIHSRVGHPEGPQVNDPRAPEWEKALDAHLNWWDKVVGYHRKVGTTLRITTEFGPFPYMPTLPYTTMPLADQWDINVSMMELFKERYL